MLPCTIGKCTVVFTSTVKYFNLTLLFIYLTRLSAYSKQTGTSEEKLLPLYQSKRDQIESLIFDSGPHKK